MESGMVPEKDVSKRLKTCIELFIENTGSSPLSSGLWSSLMDCKFGIMKTLLGNSPIR